MGKKKTLEEYIEKSNIVHNNQYDYSLITDYKNTSTKVPIICLIHGIFYQSFHSHIGKYKQGCPKCGIEKRANSKRKELTELIEKSNKVHNNKFDYSRIKSINTTKDKVEIICPIHGIFKTSFNQHIDCNQGCPKCGHERKNDKTRKSLEENIEKSNKVHNNKYNYSLIKTIRNKITKVPIICPIHRVFYQTFKNHINNKNGCPTCSNTLKKSLEECIEKSNIIHNSKYEYSLITEYENTSQKVPIICPIHGIFKQPFNSHIHRKNGCPSCSKNHSHSQITWIDYISNKDNIFIQHMLNGGEHKVGKYKADGYCKQNNTIYEYHGDYFHGNPDIYDKHEINTKVKKPFGLLYENTIKKKEYIKSKGYNYIEIWESEWIRFLKTIKKVQKIYRYYH